MACESRVHVSQAPPAALASSVHLFVHLCALLKEEVQHFKNNFWMVFMFLQRQTLLRQLTYGKSL